MKPCMWNGVKYPSIATAAEAEGVNYQTMVKRIRIGHSSDNDINSRLGHSIPIIYNGIKYPSISAAARVCDISVEGMCIRLGRRGR